MICTKCSTAKYFIDKEQKCTSCSIIHKACLECSSSSGCTKCSNGYSLHLNSCIECNGNCLNCTLNNNNETLCLQCKENYALLVVDTCDRCPVNCRSCFFLNDKLLCSSCVQGYALDTYSKECFKCPDYCEVCKFNSLTSKAKCTKCQENIGGKSWTLTDDGSCTGKDTSFIFFSVS